jgi:hypothetical protein
MANFKTRSDDEIFWSNKPGNRGKTYPGDEIARQEYDRDKARGENNLSTVRNFLFGKSDARKRDANDAIDRRIAEKGQIPIEPAGPMTKKRTLSDRILDSFPMATIKNNAAKAGFIEPPVSLNEDSASKENERNKTDLMQKLLARKSGLKKGGAVKTKKMASGGTASSRADGCATKGKTKGRIV